MISTVVISWKRFAQARLIGPLLLSYSLRPLLMHLGVRLLPSPRPLLFLFFSSTLHTLSRLAYPDLPPAVAPSSDIHTYVHTGIVFRFSAGGFLAWQTPQPSGWLAPSRRRRRRQDHT